MKPYHGSFEALDEKECLRLLSRMNYGHLGCYAHGEIYVVPVSFYYEDGMIYCHSRPGKKLEFLHENPEACIQIEEVKDYSHWKSVIAWGTFQEIKGDDATRAMRMLKNALSRNEPGPKPTAFQIDIASMLEMAIIWRLKINKVSGMDEGYKEPFTERRI